MMLNYNRDRQLKAVVSGSERLQKEYKLYVNKLPEELDEDGIRQVFNHYGNIDLFHRPRTNWAFVTYGSYHEAEAAIKDLHDAPPMRLEVSFAKGRRDLEHQNLPSPTGQLITKSPFSEENQVDTQDMTNPNLYVRSNQSTVPEHRNLLEALKKINPDLDTATENNQSLYPCLSNSNIYNPYEIVDHSSTNQLWTRNELHVATDSNKRVSNGRGYHIYDHSKSSNIPSNAGARLEKSSPSTYQFGQDTVKQSLGNCQMCGILAKFTCEKCFTFYCSKTCQVSDWPKHKADCQDIPRALIEVPYPTPMDKMKFEEQLISPRVPVPQHVPLRRPKKFIEIASTYENHNNITGTAFSPADSQPNIRTNSLRFPNIQRQEGNDLLVQNNFGSQISVNGAGTESPLLEMNRKSNSSETISCKRKNLISNGVDKIEQSIAFQKSTFLSRDKFQLITIIDPKNDREFMIQKVDNDEALQSLMMNLQIDAPNLPKIQPVLGSLCAVKFENIWHRACVISVNPMTVHYIDYGNEEVTSMTEFLNVDKYTNIPRFSAKMRISEKMAKNFKFKFEDEVSVKMISSEFKTIIVEIEGENEMCAPEEATTRPEDQPTMEEVQPTPNEMAHVISLTCFGDSVDLQFNVQLSNNTFGCTFIPKFENPNYHKFLADIQQEYYLKEETVFRPNVGDPICGLKSSENKWYRGYLLGPETPMQLAAIDVGQVITIDKALPYSAKLSYILPMGVTCTLKNFTLKMQTPMWTSCTVTSKPTEDEADLCILYEGFEFDGFVKPWTPVPEQRGIKLAELKNDGEVFLTFYRNHHLLYTRPLEPEDLEHYNRVMQDVAKCVQTALPLNGTPVVGEIVLSPFSVDGNYYRAIVTKVQDDNVRVSYIDYGNSESRSIADLRILDDDLKLVRSCTAKVNLKDVPQDIPMTKEINEYLGELAVSGLPLKCTFTGLPSKDGVYLKTPTGEYINDIINQMLVPTWKKPDQEENTKCYMLNDLKVAPLANLNEETAVLVLHGIEVGYKYVMSPLDHDLLAHVFDVMLNQMTEYCEKTDYYIPRENELCLALYKDKWYRAGCICRTAEQDAATILFIDFGNIETVKHTDIRLMPADFMSPEALGSICNIVNLAPTDSEGRYASPVVENRISELVQLEAAVTIKIVQSYAEDGVYDIELPEIRQVLIKEGLIAA